MSDLLVSGSASSASMMPGQPRSLPVTDLEIQPNPSYGSSILALVERLFAGGGIQTAGKIGWTLACQISSSEGVSWLLSSLRSHGCWADFAASVPLSTLRLNCPLPSSGNSKDASTFDASTGSIKNMSRCQPVSIATGRLSPWEKGNKGCAAVSV